MREAGGEFVGTRPAPGFHAIIGLVNGDRPVEVFYNRVCPVCRAGMDNQRRAMARSGCDDGVIFTDVAAVPDALAAEGLTLDDVRRHFYLRDETGALHRGAAAAAVLWRMTPGRRWAGQLIALPGLRGLARFVYDRFADRLYAWNRRKRRW